MTESAPESLPILSPEERAAIDERFAKGQLLDPDAANSIALAVGYIGKGNLDKLEPLQTYEEYLKEKSARERTPDNYYYYVLIKKSDPAQIARYNMKVRRFNRDLQRIKENKDQKSAEEAIKDQKAAEEAIVELHTILLGRPIKFNSLQETPTAEFPVNANERTFSSGEKVNVRLDDGTVAKGWTVFFTIDDEVVVKGPKSGDAITVSKKDLEALNPSE